MPKRRKSSGGPSSGLRKLDSSGAKINPINTWEDIPDEEDEFHISRDKVMLGGEDFGRQRVDEYGDVSDEEVLALDYDDNDSSSAGEDDDEEEEEEEVQKGSKRKAQADDSDDDDDRSEQEDKDAEGWGTSRNDYYGGDAVETEQDAALEEAEVLRLQTKQLAAMDEADFMLDEEDWKADKKEEGDESSVAGVRKPLVITEELPTVIPETMSTVERMKILKARHPEFEPLAEEFAELQPLHAPLSLSAAAAEAVGETVKSSVAIVKFRALSAYLGVLSMYFAVLSSSDVVQTQGMKIREHGVMEGLVKCRRMWGAVKDLEVEEISSKGVERKRKAEVNSDGGNTLATAPSKKKKADKKTKEPERKRTNLSPDSDSNPSHHSKKTPPASDFSDLTTLATSFCSTKPKPMMKISTSTSNLDTSDFGDDVQLGSLEAEQKAARRRSLRFYTSQIVSKSTKRDLAGQGAGGDTDIPYRERRKEKGARLAAEAARRRNSGADLDDEDPNEEDKRVAKEMREAEGDNEYYDMLASRSKQKKAEKKAYHDAAKVGGNVKVVEEEKDGKRAIGYVIEKNKGLTPHRKKDVRNPRVKKRKKYEEAKKKLGSKKALYKGGLQGAYGGEMTGIKKNLVKSVKFA